MGYNTTPWWETTHPAIKGTLGWGNPCYEEQGAGLDIHNESTFIWFPHVDNIPVYLFPVDECRRQHIPQNIMVFNIHYNTKDLGYIYWDTDRKVLSIWTRRYNVKEDVKFNNLMRYIEKNKKRF